MIFYSFTLVIFVTKDWREKPYDELVNDLAMCERGGPMVRTALLGFALLVTGCMGAVDQPAPQALHPAQPPSYGMVAVAQPVSAIRDAVNGNAAKPVAEKAPSTPSTPMQQAPGMVDPSSFTTMEYDPGEVGPVGVDEPETH
jgi:hypothetical protein